MFFNHLYSYALHLKEASQRETNIDKKNQLVRNAVSKGYYSCHHLLKEYAIRNLRYIPVQTSSTSHDDLINKYHGSIHRDFRDKIRDLKQYRITCDYETSEIDLNEIITDAFELIEEIRTTEIFRSFLRQNAYTELF